MRRGTYGHEAGAAYVAERVGDQWVEETKLRPDDGDSGDHFGYSVALIDASTGHPDHFRRVVAFVGAPGTENHGRLEQQVVECRADGGSFRLGFRGVATEPIPFDATARDLQRALAALDEFPDTVGTTDRIRIHPAEVID